MLFNHIPMVLVLKAWRLITWALGSDSLVLHPTPHLLCSLEKATSLLGVLVFSAVKWG